MAEGAVTLSLVLPTVSRPTLVRALASLRGQAWAAGDEILVVGDGAQPVAAEVCEQFAGAIPVRYLETPATVGRWGHGPRNWLLDVRGARGSHLIALDDDDAYTPGAIEVIRTALAEQPGRPHLFRADFTAPSLGFGVLWADPVIREGNVSTCLFACPNDPPRLARYGPSYTGDCDFIRATCGFYADGPVWRPEVIAVARPAG